MSDRTLAISSPRTLTVAEADINIGDPLKIELAGRLHVPPRTDGKKRKGPRLLPDIIRFLICVDNSESNPRECWLWEGERNWAGYGRFLVKRSDGSWHRTAAHRWLYEDQFGALEREMDLDHLCRNRACVNTAHLEPVSRRTNLLRGQTTTARNAAATHCPRGHFYSPDNTLFTKRGTRYCRECNRHACNAYTERRNA